MCVDFHCRRCRCCCHRLQLHCGATSSSSQGPHPLHPMRTRRARRKIPAGPDRNSRPQNERELPLPNSQATHIVVCFVARRMSRVYEYLMFSVDDASSMYGVRVFAPFSTMTGSRRCEEEKPLCVYINCLVCSCGSDGGGSYESGRMMSVLARTASCRLQLLLFCVVFHLTWSLNPHTMLACRSQ